MQSLLHLLSAAIGIYIWIILIQVILSWLIAFKVINMSNQFVYMISNTFYRLTEPALQPIRRFMPNLGGVDISPVILILLLYFVQNLLHEEKYKYLRQNIGLIFYLMPHLKCNLLGSDSAAQYLVQY
ncbi:MAG: YggT family protein, partial [Rickettsiales bacterium]